MSRGELARRAGGLAARLAAEGVGGGDRVALHGAAAPELVAAFLGAWRVGAAVVPVDPGWGEARRAEVLADAACEVFVGPTGSDPGGLPFLAWDADAGDLRPAPPARAGDVAYWIYTSGSTGRPKGVGIRHDNLAAHLAAMGSVLDLAEDDRALQFASPAFDLFLEEVLVPLAAGATVVLREPDLPLDPAGFVAWLTARRITLVGLPASFWRAQVEVAPTLALPARVHTLVVGNELVDARSYEAWRRTHPGVRFLNAYGPTETTITSAAHVATGPEPGASVPVGRPLPGEEIRVVDARGEPLPPGVPGEVVIAGAGVGAGYRARPEEDAARFPEDPRAPGSGRRVFRTGDRGRWRPDGSLEVLGRLDRQVKVRGHRVELEEVEHHLGEVPGVAACAAWVREGELVAALEWRGPGEPTRELLIHHLAGVLPAAVVPAAFLRMDVLPRTSAGKVDRDALRQAPALPGVPVPAGAADSPPATPTERRVAELFREVTGAAAVSRDRDFFACGGTSLGALRLVHRLREDLGVALELAELYRGATVAALARRIDSPGDPGAPGPAAISLLRHGRGDAGLVFLPGSGASSLGLLALVRRLRTRRPIHAFDWNVLIEDPAAIRVEDLARHGARELARAGTLRRVAIVGWSTGGVVGYELAEALREVGVEVERLVLLDSYWPRDLAVSDLLEGDARVAMLDHALEAGVLGPDADPAELDRVVDEVRRAEEVFSRYRADAPRAVPGALITAREFPGEGSRQEDAARAWEGRFAGPLARREVRGDHYSMLREPAVEDLASALEELLDEGDVA